MVATDFQRWIRRELPPLPDIGGAVLDQIVLTGGSAPPTAPLASRLGLSNRYALARLMHREGLPGIRELGSWITILGWVWEAEQTDDSLFVIAIRHHRSPAGCYRLVKRLTGFTWIQLRERGTCWLVERLEHRCRDFGRQVLKVKRRPHRPIETYRRVDSRGHPKTSS